jgi:hypothetical protein
VISVTVANFVDSGHEHSEKHDADTDPPLAITAR